MGAKFINVDRDTPMMLPPCVQDWLPQGSMVHFVVDAVEMLDLKGFVVNERGSGNAQYPPKMLLALLIYCYATGRFSSREIELATYSDVAVRYICGGDLHPDHDTICEFRVKNHEAFKDAFVKVLMLAGELGQMKKVGGISVDGSKINANASKHSAVSYKRAGEMIRQLELEIEELTRKAEEADNAPLADGLILPDEIKRRGDRKAAMEKARSIIEERYAEVKLEKQREYEMKKGIRDELRKTGKKPRGKDPQPPPSAPPGDMQFNFTDGESRIMKAGNGQHFEQSYNAQAAVDTEGSMLILGKYVTNHANDKLELKPGVASVDPAVRKVDTASADTGYFSESAVLEVEAGGEGPTVYCAVEKQSHHRTVDDLLKKAEPDAPPENATVKENMAYRLKTKEGRAIYKKRKETVEPVFGIVKSVLGFRQFLLRGLKKVAIEWDVATLAYNFKRLHKLCGGHLMSGLLKMQMQNG
ncbi:MAG: IS1182 family transposase [Elusimicrobiota bacterium]